MAAYTAFYAIATKLRIAAFAQRRTVVAENTVAFGATYIAFTAHDRFAFLAFIPLITTDRGITVDARYTVPVRDGYEWTARVVGSQQVDDDQKEVEQTTLLQRLFNRLATFAFAEALILDVRMGDTFTGRSRIGIDCNHSIFTGVTGSQVVPVEADLKRT